MDLQKTKEKMETEFISSFLNKKRFPKLCFLSYVLITQKKNVKSDKVRL